MLGARSTCLVRLYRRGVGVTDENRVIDISKPSTQQQFADLVGVSQQAISDLCRRDVLSQGQEIGEWLKRYCSHLREQAAGRATNGDLDLATERAALARAQREKIDMQNDITRKNFGPIEALAMGLSDLTAVIASKLDTIPGKLKVASDRLTADDLDLVATVIADVRNDIADMNIDWFGDNDEGDDVTHDDTMETDG